MKTISTVVVAAALAFALPASGAAPAPSGNELFQKALVKERSEGDLAGAIKLYQTVLQKHGKDRKLAAKALLQLGRCHERLGQADARKAYERLLREYAEQTEQVEDARAGLAALGRPAHPSAVTLRRVWAGPGSDATGGISPDGRYLSFTDWETGDLAVRDLATGQNRRLTRKGAWNDSAEYALNSTWSPDGKRVAYGWYNKDSYYDLRLVGLDGSQPRVLLADKEWTWLQPFDWSPNGKEILALLSRTGLLRIVLVSAAQVSLRVLKEWPDSRWPQKLSFSPDGRHIVCDPYGGARPPGGEIFLLSSAGGEETPLIQHPAGDWSPVWTPDGKKVLFASDRTGTLGFWAIEVTDGKPQGSPELVKPDIGRLAWTMGFTRQGSLYYTVETGMEDVYVTELDPATGKMLAPPARVANRFVGTNMGPSWSPDGQYLAYHSWRGPLPFDAPGALTIVIKSVKTGEERDLSIKLDQNSPVRWFPDGKSFLVRTTSRERSDRPPGLYRINAESGEVSLIKRVTGVSSHRPELSPDGKAIFYVQHENSKATRIVVHQMETGEEKELFRSVSPQSIRQNLCPSPDGRQLAFVLRDSATSSAAVKIMPAGGGELRELIGGPQYRDVEAGGWSPDGRYLFIVTGGKLSQLWRVSAEGGEPQKLDVNMRRLRYPAVHPDGRRIVFDAGTRRDQDREVWVMENLLPPAGAK
ncbi:MAG: tetratricopeptide repeat protein [Acidobacteriota bacterium]